MLNERSVVDLIERAFADRPYCDCGRSAITTYRDGAMWLECSIVDEPAGNRVNRLWNALTEPGHVHAKIVDVPTPELAAA